MRAAIGEAPDLMLDMNAPYDLPDCIEFAHRVEPHRVFWLEEPLHWYLQPADFARLAAATPIPLAHGERELTRFTVRDFIVDGGIRYVQFDATRAAGFTEALRVAALAEPHGVIVAPHTAPEIHGHLVLALPRCAYGVESHGGPDTDPLAHGLFHEHPELRDGFHIGDGPASVSTRTGPLSSATGRRSDPARCVRSASAAKKKKKKKKIAPRIAHSGFSTRIASARSGEICPWRVYGICSLRAGSHCQESVATLHITTGWRPERRSIRRICCQ